MKIYYCNKPDREQGVLFFGSRGEMLNFARCLVTDDAVILGEPVEHDGYWIQLKLARFKINPKYRIMIYVEGSEVIFTGNRYVLEGYAERVEEFANNPPIDQELHYPYYDDHPSFDKNSLSFSLNIDSE